jgi:hypothetical protein
MIQMKKNTLILLIGSIIILLIAIFFFLHIQSKLNTGNLLDTSNSTTTNTLEEAKETFYFYDTNGEKLSLKDFEGLPAIIVLWNSTSSNSLDVLQLLDSYYDLYKDTVAFITVNTNEESTRISSLLEDINFSMPIYYDTDLTARKEYNFSELPYIIFIDKNGEIQKTVEGSITEDSLTASLDLLSENYD